jgi:hypothetical protein
LFWPDDGKWINEEWPLEYVEAKCDPWDETEHFEKALSRIVQAHQEQSVGNRPLFEAGRYMPGSGTELSRSSMADALAYELRRMTDVVGIPLYMRNVNVLGWLFKPVMKLTFEPTTRWYLLLIRVLNGHDDPLLDLFFGRVAVAKMPTTVAQTLIATVLSALSYWRSRDARSLTADRVQGEYTEHLRLFIEVIARLAPRMTPTQARSTFDLAIELSNDRAILHPWLHEPIDHLLHFTIESVPPSERSDLVFPALAFPLSGKLEHFRKNPWRWPNPLNHLLQADAVRPDGDTAWNRRIHDLAVAVSQPTNRLESVLRLAYLSERDVLTSAEKDLIGENLWANLDAEQPPLPKAEDLYPHVFLKLPAPSRVRVADRMRVRLFDVSGPRLFNDLTLVSIANISRLKPGLLPDSAQARRLFDELVQWRPNPAQGEGRQPNRSGNLEQGIGEALFATVVPSLGKVDLTSSRLSALIEQIEQTSVCASVASLPYFSNLGEQELTRLTLIIRKQMTARRHEQVRGAANALTIWARIAGSRNAVPLPRSLIEHLISLISFFRDEGLICLLDAARQLSVVGQLTDLDIERLWDALDGLLSDTAYDAVDLSGRRAIVISLERRECVLLAKQLCAAMPQQSARAQSWFDSARDDPLPEVRFAGSDYQD